MEKRTNKLVDIKSEWALRAFIVNADAETLVKIFGVDNVFDLLKPEDYEKNLAKYNAFYNENKPSEIKDGILVYENKKVGVILSAENKLVLWENKDITHYEEEPTLVKTSKGKLESVFYRGKNPFVERIRTAIDWYNKMFTKITYVDPDASGDKDEN